MRDTIERHVRGVGRAAAVAAVAIMLSTGGAWAQDAENEINDPFEDFNRAIFEFNRVVDRALLRPLAEGYRFLLPQFSRDMIMNFLDNLRTPVVLANDLLQGKVGRAGVTVHRFLFNSTFGFGGLFDFAGDMGMPGHDEDFGQTLAVWGFGEGPYLVLPLLGPAPPRDAIGLGVDTFFDPLTYVDVALYVGLARTGTRVIDERSRHIESLDEIEQTSIDFYATIRSLYRQRRNDEIRDGAAPPTIPIPSISIDFEVDEGKEKVSLLPGK